jgi:nucleotide-binding universal stress UspA family protein
MTDAAATPRLVVGDDGSAAADVVWLWVNNHRWTGWRVSVLTASPPEAGPPVGAVRAAPHPWDPPHPRELLGADDVPVEHLLAEADPRLALDSCADASLVAIGPRGRGVLKHLHLGSTAEWLISYRRPLAPVVVVRSARRTRDVLLCVDGSDHAQSAAECLASLPWAAECHVQVLGVNARGLDTTSAVDEAAELLTRSGVREVRRRVIDAPPPTAAELDVREAVLAVIRADSPDLVVVGARGVGGLEGLLVGSVTSTVVHHAPCSVLVARSG